MSPLYEIVLSNSESYKAICTKTCICSNAHTLLVAVNLFPVPSHVVSFVSQDSKFFRVHKVLPVSTFKVKDAGDLVLSQPFLQFLHALPLEYNYALYRDIFQRFGTHYYSSGKLGGHYDLLYQYSREEIKYSGSNVSRLFGYTDFCVICMFVVLMW